MDELIDDIMELESKGTSKSRRTRSPKESQMGRSYRDTTSPDLANVCEKKGRNIFTWIYLPFFVRLIDFVY